MKKTACFFTIALTIFQSIYTTPFTLASIYEELWHNKKIQFHACHNQIPFEYKPFPIIENPYFHPHRGILDKAGVFIIPNGKAWSTFAYIHDDKNQFFKEFFTTELDISKHLEYALFLDFNNDYLRKISGKVVVLTRINITSYRNWISEVLGQLALLKQHNISYDWLYVPYECPFMKETLSLLGVDLSKILQPWYENYYIQADELIVPSLPARYLPAPGDNDYIGGHPAVTYCAHWNFTWLKDTFIPMANQQIIDNDFCDKVFISRQDTGKRQITNEDELFAYFEKKGFKRYRLAEMSFLQQVKLFHQAKYIVGAHGSGLTNIIFSNPNTCVIELVQNKFNSTYWYWSQDLQLHHHCIKTRERTYDDANINTYVPINIVADYINKHIPDLQ